MQDFGNSKRLTQPELTELTIEEEACEQQFNETHERRTDGKYVVKLPFKDDHEKLGDSYKMAIVRFNSLERTLSRNPQLRADYQKFLDEYEEMGHMSLADAETQKTVYYLPHHAVHRPSSSTTKLRVVFDASAKTKTGVSLNDIQMVGPKLQQDLASIMMRWRMHKIVFTADIAKMYRQIYIHENHQDFQRILWRKNPLEKIKHYKLKTVTYGTSSAPYLAIRTLQQLAKDEKENFKIGSKLVRRDFYVDDLMSGANTIQEAIIAQNEIRELLSRGGLPIRKWTSNSEELLLNVPAEDREISLPLQIDAENLVKTLGISWNPATDKFFIFSVIGWKNVHKKKIGIRDRKNL